MQSESSTMTEKLILKTVRRINRISDLSKNFEEAYSRTTADVNMIREYFKCDEFEGLILSILLIEGGESLSIDRYVRFRSHCPRDHVKKIHHDFIFKFEL